MPDNPPLLSSGLWHTPETTLVDADCVKQLAIVIVAAVSFGIKALKKMVILGVGQNNG